MKIHVFTGPMFSGKTTALIGAYHKTLTPKGAYKPLLDSREGDEYIHSHTGQRILATRTRIKPIGTYLPPNVFIDEAQFISEEDIEFILSDTSRTYFLSMLNKDYLGREFPNFSRIGQSGRAIIQEFRSRCAVCGEEAEFSHRKVDATELILCGSGDLYEPRCHAHFPVLWMQKAIPEYSPAYSP